MKRVALFTVFYPGVENYLNDFMDSLSSQTFTDFDLIIVNDNCPCQNILEKYPDVNIIELRYSSSIAGNREYGINFIRNAGYELLILCDADDYFHPLRIETIVKTLESFDVTFHDFDIVGEKGNVLVQSYFQKNGSNLDSIDKYFIQEKNVFGFSNSAFRLSVLNSNVVFPKDLKIVDWFLFTKIIYQGVKVKYIHKSLTYYRQHSDNLIGIGDCTIDLFKRMLDQRIYHCQLCSNLDPFFAAKGRDLFALRDMTDKEIEKIIIKNKVHNPYPLWWENITN